MHALMLVVQASLALPLVASSAPARERPILIEVEELPASEIRQIVQNGRTAEGSVPFSLSVERAEGGKGGTAIALALADHRFEAVRLDYLPFESVNRNSISIHSRNYPHGRVLRVHLRYGRPAPRCRVGDDGRGKVSITYRVGSAPEIVHRMPARC